MALVLGDRIGRGGRDVVGLAGQQGGESEW